MGYQREYDEPLRIAVVGVGSHAYRNILPVLTFLPVSLVAVCDIEEELAKKTARQYGAKAYTKTTEMYEKEELDAVLLCVSPQLHPSLAVEAFEAGLHVWIEKPAAMRVGQVDDMIRHRGDKVCVVGYKKAFMPAVRKAVEITSDEKYGPIRSILGVYPMSIPENGALVLENNEMSRWLADGCHPLAVMLAVGGRIETVTVHRGRHAGGACILEFENGAVGNLHLGEGTPVSQPFEWYSFFCNQCRVDIENSRRVVFQKGIQFDYTHTDTFAPEGTDGGAHVWEAQDGLNTLENKALFTQGIYNELKYFCDCVQQRESPDVGSLEFALQITGVYEAGLLSDGTPVEVRKETYR